MKIRVYLIYFILIQIKKEDAKLFDIVIFEESRLEQKLWPTHCIIDSWGAQLHKDLKIAENSEKVNNII